jgi:hypothetical protein
VAVDAEAEVAAVVPEAVDEQGAAVPGAAGQVLLTGGVHVRAVRRELSLSPVQRQLTLDVRTEHHDQEMHATHPSVALLALLFNL